MYIGAWTEYRLAQEQHSSCLKRRHNNAAQPPPGEFGTSCPRRSSTTSASRHGAGIYHPSLADKGSTEVAGLPNRESFRRTLESALSSNLAADDAENISQALEPLLQRLPTIRTPHRQRRRISQVEAAVTAGGRGGEGASAGAGGSLRRSQQRKTTRRHRTSLDKQHGCLRFRHTCSDAGTRSSARHWSSVDGTRSGFSVASAPAISNAAAAGAAGRGRRDEHNRRLLYLKRCDGHTVGHRHGAGGVTGRGVVPQLPLILDTRRRHSTTSVSRNRGVPPAAALVVPSRGAHRGSSSTADCSIIDGDDPPSGGNNGRAFHDEDSVRPENHNIEGGQKAVDVGAAQTVAAGAVQGDCCPGDEAVASGGGRYDRDRAASILRVARRRDPARLKADFQQFWTWNKRSSATSDEDEHECAAQRTRDFARTGFADVSRKRCSRDSGSSPSPSRLEMLARMKAVYMAKIDSAINSSSSDALGVPEAIFPESPGNPSSDEEDGGVFPAAPPFPASPAARFRREEAKIVEPQRDPPPRDRAPSVTGRDEATTTHPCTTKLDGTGQDLWKSGSGSGRGARGDGGISNPIHGVASTTSVEGEQAVVVPDLELTESRIRLVDKYFGGSGGAERRRQRLPVAEEGGDQYRAHAVIKEVGGLRGGVLSDAAAGPLVEDRGDTSPVKPRSSSSSGGCSNGFSDSRASFDEFGEAVSSDTAVELRKQALQANAAAPELPKHHPPSSLPNVADRNIDSACAADSTMNRGTAGKAQGRFPPDMSGAYLSEKGCSAAWSPTPPASPFARAWCGDNSSLDDLVCWTKGLDFDAAVEGL